MKLDITNIEKQDVFTNAQKTKLKFLLQQKAQIVNIVVEVRLNGQKGKLDSFGRCEWNKQN